MLKPVADTAKLETLAASRGRLVIELDHPDYRMIYLGFDVVPAFEVIPRQIVAFDAEPNEPLVRTVPFRSHEADSGENAAFEVESVTSQNTTCSARPAKGRKTDPRPGDLS